MRNKTANEIASRNFELHMLLDLMWHSFVKEFKNGLAFDWSENYRECTYDFCLRINEKHISDLKLDMNAAIDGMQSQEIFKKVGEYFAITVKNTLLVKNGHAPINLQGIEDGNKKEM